jgi:hypothetical protein
MAYDRTRTEKAAFGLIDNDHYVECGPLEVPYLAFRKSELKKVEETHEDPDAFHEAMFEVINYRYGGELPREDFDEFVSIQDLLAYFISNRSNQKKAVVKPELTLLETTESTGPA